jgi:hypothetical protein
VGIQVGERRSPPVAGLHHRRHPLAPARIRHTHHHGVEDVRMGLERRLHLFRVDLLAARVDADGAAAEDLDGPVLQHRGHVSGQHPAHAVLLDEGARGLLRVVVVAQRDVALLGQHADDTGARLDGIQVVVEHRVALVHLEAQALVG